MRVNSDHDEIIIFSAEIHWISVLPRAAVAALIVIVLWYFGAAVLWIVLAAVFIIERPLTWFLTTNLILTNKRLIGKSGLIVTKSLDSPISKLNNVMVERGLLGKVFDYGDVVVSTSSSAYRFHSIVRPEYVREGIMAQIEKFEDDRLKKQAAEVANAMRGNGKG